MIPEHTLKSIIYLASAGSVVGAVLFYYSLRHLNTGKIALLTLITPVTALLIGHQFNHEIIELNTIVGTACVILGFMSYQWDDGSLLKRIVGK